MIVQPTPLRLAGLLMPLGALGGCDSSAPVVKWPGGDARLPGEGTGPGGG